MQCPKDVVDVLREHFKQNKFRELQEEIINEALTSRDLLVVLPTGYGKSLTFQVPAVYESLKENPGFYVVVSPLLALINDQVNHLQSLGIEAYSINSELSNQERRDIMARFVHGNSCLLYVSPEQCFSKQFEAFLLQCKHKIRRFVIDEAHCAVEWGSDFRKDYAMLGSHLRTKYRHVPIMALTGTASQQMRAQISFTLRLNSRTKREFVAKVHRPYLHYEVRYVEDQADRLHDLLKFLKMYRGRIAKLNKIVAPNAESHGYSHGYPGCGIIYCRSRASTELLSQEINRELGECSSAYHAGLQKEERAQVMQRWIDGEPQCSIVVATIAFGLGVDKPDTRFVIHFNMPQNMESFVQQTGRGGRDRKAARCILYYSMEDSQMCQRFAQKYTSSDAKAATVALLKFANDIQRCRHQMVGNYFGDNDGQQYCYYACDHCKAPLRLQQRYDEWYSSHT